jgi:iron complex transport system permease protein
LTGSLDLAVSGYSVRLQRRSCAVGVGLALLVLVAATAALSTGTYVVPPLEVVRTLLGLDHGVAAFVIGTLRLPRMLVGVLVGMALGVGGAVFQSLSRNPLGSPDIVGFDAGAATGALLVIVLARGAHSAVALGALAGGLATALLVYLLARGGRGYRMILVGIGIAAMLTSANHYLLTRAEITDAQTAAVWLTGSLHNRSWSEVTPVALAVLVLLPCAVALGRPLRTLELGDDMAGALGVRAERVRLWSVVVAVGLTAVATSSAGPIVFIALAAPQVARRLTGMPGPNVLVSALTGAALLSVGDLAAQRLFAPAEVPVGVMTGSIGGIYLAWLLSREWRKGRG